MTTSPISPTSTTPTPDPSAGLRLQLRGGPQTRAVDGAWWPRSHDLRAEAADLVDHFPPDAGRISRLLFSRPDWEPDGDGSSPHAIRASRGMVKTGSFPRDDTHVMELKMSTGRRLRLLVVPSETDAALAASVMDRAADPASTRSPRSLLGLPDDGGGR